MSDGCKKKNPGVQAGAPLQSSCRWIAFTVYRNGLAGTTTMLPFVPVAVEGAMRLWGGLQ